MKLCAYIYLWKNLLNNETFFFITYSTYCVILAFYDNAQWLYCYIFTSKIIYAYILLVICLINRKNWLYLEWSFRKTLHYIICNAEVVRLLLLLHFISYTYILDSEIFSFHFYSKQYFFKIFRTINYAQLFPLWMHFFFQTFEELEEKIAQDI